MTKMAVEPSSQFTAEINTLNKFMKDEGFLAGNKFKEFNSENFIKENINFKSQLNDSGSGGKQDTLLIRAARLGNMNVLDILLNKVKLDGNQTNSKGETALYWAAVTGKLAVAELLLEKGGDVDKGDIDGTTPFDVALSRRHIDILELFQKDLNRQLAAKKEQLADREEEEAALERQLAQSDVQSDALERQLAAKKEQLAANKEEQLAVEEEEAALRRQLSQLDTKEESLEAHKDILNKKVAVNNEEIAVNEALEDIINEKIAAEEEKIAVNNEKGDALKEQLEAFEALLDVNNEEMAVVKEEIAAGEEKMAVNKELSAVKKELLAVIRSQLDVKNILDAKKEQLAAEEEKAYALERQLAQLDATERQLSAKKEQLAAGEKRISVDKEWVAALRRQLDVEKEQLAVEEEEVAVLERQLAQLDATKRQLSAKEEQLEAVAQKLSIKMENMESESEAEDSHMSEEAEPSKQFTTEINKRKVNAFVTQEESSENYAPEASVSVEQEEFTQFSRGDADFVLNTRREAEKSGGVVFTNQISDLYLKGEGGRDKIAEAVNAKNAIYFDDKKRVLYEDFQMQFNSILRAIQQANITNADSTTFTGENFKQQVLNYLSPLADISTLGYVGVAVIDTLYQTYRDNIFVEKCSKISNLQGDGEKDIRLLSEGLARKIVLDKELLNTIYEAIGNDAQKKSGKKGLFKSSSSKVTPVTMPDRVTVNNLSDISPEISKISILLLGSIFESEEFNERQIVNVELVEGLHNKLRVKLGLSKINHSVAGSNLSHGGGGIVSNSNVSNSSKMPKSNDKPSMLEQLNLATDARRKVVEQQEKQAAEDGQNKSDEAPKIGGLTREDIQEIVKHATGGLTLDMIEFIKNKFAEDQARGKKTQENARGNLKKLVEQINDVLEGKSSSQNILPSEVLKKDVKNNEAPPTSVKTDSKSENLVQTEKDKELAALKDKIEKLEQERGADRKETAALRKMFEEKNKANCCVIS